MRDACRPGRPVRVRDPGDHRARRAGRGAERCRSRSWTCRPAGWSTPRWLDENGGFRADLTVMRLAADRFRVVTGGATGMADAAWIRRPPARHGRVLADLTSAWTTIGLWGPRARDVLRRGDRRRRVARRVRVRHLPRDRGRRRRRARVAHLLRGRARLGAARADRAGAAAVGRAVAGRAAGTGWCRPASACTAPPGGWRRGTGRSAPS